MKTYIGQLTEVSATAVQQGTPDFEGRVERQIGKRVAMTQFCVNHLTLHPGAMSSRRHWHEGEDEFVYVLSGVVTLCDESGDHQIGARQYVDSIPVRWARRAFGRKSDIFGGSNSWIVSNR